MDVESVGSSARSRMWFPPRQDRQSRSFADVVMAAVVAEKGSRPADAVSSDYQESTNTETGEQNHQSRKNAWIKKRWKAAFHTVRAIGTWTRLDELRKTEADGASNRLSDGILKRKWHTFSPYSHEQAATCTVCGKECKDEGDDERDDDTSWVKCQHCPIVVHEICVNSITAYCQGQKLRFPLRKQKSITPGDEYGQQGRRFSLAGEGEDEYVVSEVSSHQPHPTVVVDPIYLALKEANRMATTRRVSVASSPSPVGLSACSPRDLTPSDSMKELTVNRMAWCKMPSSASATSGASSGYSSNSGNPGGTKSLRNSPARMQSVSSTPSLTAQKSTESQEGTSEFRRPVAAAASVSNTSSKRNRRPPKLGSKMKSLSLDCPDAKGRSKGTSASGYSPVGRRVLKVRPCRNNSFDVSDDGADPSSTSCSPSLSPYCGSTLTLPSNSYAVTHDHRAKFPEEIDLCMGERVMVFDTGDPDWWQGQNISGRIGIFPSTCAAHIHSNERIMQVVQNLNLWDGTKSLRLYRDQIVFAQHIDPDGLVEIRTEHDHRINCPIQYLMCLD